MNKIFCTTIFLLELVTYAFTINECVQKAKERKNIKKFNTKEKEVIEDAEIVED